MSAPRASGTPSTSSPTAELASVRIARVWIPGSARTYEVRAVLRELGLRWDPQTHAWHGTLPSGRCAVLDRELGLRPQVVTPIEAFASDHGRDGPKVPPTGPRPASPQLVARQGSKRRLEAQAAFQDEDPEGSLPIPARFSLQDVTSGLPDDSREADDRVADRHLRLLRGRVKAARAVVSSTPGLAEVIAGDRKLAAAFCARWGITEGMFCDGVPAGARAGEEGTESLSSPTERIGEAQARGVAVFPRTDLDG